MYLLERLTATLLFPLPVILILLITGLIFLLFDKKTKTAKILLSVGVLLLLLLSFSGISKHLLLPLEKKYPAALKESNFSEYINIKWVVVLGGGVTSDPALPISSQLNESTLARLVEGIRIYRKIQGCKLLLCGGKSFNTHAESEVMKELAIELGVEPSKIITETNSLQTSQQAIEVKKIVEIDEFLLITSASHLPRAVAMFQKQGLKPFAIPAGHLVKIPQVRDFICLPLPDVHGLQYATAAIYEYYATIGAWLKRDI